MKGIVLAGGTGKRLWPMTIATSKQMLPIHNKPLIYYPISILMYAGIREIALITTPFDQIFFQKLLGNGSEFGLKISYLIQENPEGIAQSFIVAKDFIGSDDVALILGDNLFYGSSLLETLPKKMNDKGGTVFTYSVSNPSDYGVLNLDSNGKPKFVEEKPKNPKSDLAITGLYFFDNKVIEYAEIIKPSKRGELEITDIIQIYIDDNDLDHFNLPAGTAWLDTGTPNSLSDASQFVRVLEDRTGKKIACLEEIAFHNGWIKESDLQLKINHFGNNSYGQYLQSILIHTEKP
jgi:glucose-1-phosphate thymidylyltransferase